MVNSQFRSFEKIVKWRPDDVAISDLYYDIELTYEELHERIAIFASNLWGRGVREGDRVILVMGNTSEFPISVYACHKLGSVSIPLNYRLSSGEMAEILDDTMPTAVVYEDRFGETVDAALDRAPGDPDPIEFHTGSMDAEGFHDLIESGGEPVPTVERGPETPSYMIYTSGTTGEAKGVVHTARSAHERVHAVITAFDFHPDVVTFSQLPFFHGGGLAVGIRATFTVGGELVIDRNYADPAGALTAINECDVTHMVGTPSVTDRFVGLDGVDMQDFSSIETWYHTGEVMQSSQASAFIDNLTPNIYNCYGSSEGGIVTVLRPEILADNVGAAGIPTYNTDLRIVEIEPTGKADPDKEVANGKPGEVILSGPQLYAGYFGGVTKENDPVRHGWYYTGDMGFIKEGILTITGRKDDVIVSGGELISPPHVEDVLEAHPGVDEAVVVGVPDDEWGERVKAVINGDVSAEDLEQFCLKSTELADFRRPREYEFVAEISRTETGKKERQKYR